MGKAVLFIRVSTEKQTLDTQSQELREFAIRDGYAPEDLIKIAEKESARKRGKVVNGHEEDRRGIKRFKELVQSDSSIDALYLWELSRLGRRQKVIMDLREFCIDHKINIIIKTPSVIRLLNEQGEIDAGADMVFTLFAQFAESEMRQKLERFHREKVRNASIGKHNGTARPMFGYTLDDNNFYIVNEDEAEIVRLVFRKCVEGMSTSQISKYLNQLDIRTTPHLVRHILSSEAYTGEATNFRPNRQKEPITRKYPVIISKELFDKAAQARKEHQTSVAKGCIYYCRSLILCPSCGRPLVANSSPGTCAYRCSRYAVRYPTLRDMSAQPRCNGGQSVNINAIDSITWCLVSGLLYPQYLVRDRVARRKKLEKEISEVKQLIDALEKRYAGVDESIERLSEQYILRRISDERYEVLQARILEKKGEIDADKVRFTEQLSTLERMLDATEGGEFITARFLNFRKAQALTRQVADDQTRHNIIHTVLKSIRLENIGAKGLGHIRIEFTAYDGRTCTCEYHLRRKPPKTIEFDRGEGVTRLEFEWLDRFKRSK